MTQKKICPYGCGKEWYGSTSRRAENPLDPDAVGKANEATWDNCDRLTHSDGTRRQLTMEADDSYCRTVWMDAYLAEIDKKEPKKKPPPRPKVNPKSPVEKCPTGQLIVKVTDFDGKPIEEALVKIPALGDMLTDENGLADYGEVMPKTYNITAEKENYSRHILELKPGLAETTKEVPPCQTVVAELQLNPLPHILRENVIFIGSEHHYENFWLQMMFIGAAFYMIDHNVKIRTADKKTIMYVDDGYTRWEKLPLEALRRRRGYNVMRVSSSSAIVDYLNDRPMKGIDKTLLQDVVFFCHGTPGRIALNYQGSPNVDFTATELASLKTEIFVPDEGRIYSFACRTGVSSTKDEFDNDADAKPENSLAQKLADRLKIEVHAFLRRSFYGKVLREKSDSDRIIETLNKGRETMDGTLIDIPPEHEGLPHEGLDQGGWSSDVDYALWRKLGGITLPEAGETPEGLSREMRVFKPK